MIDYAVELGIVEENVFRKIKINKKLFCRTKKPTSDTQIYLVTEQPMIVDEMLRWFKNNPRSTAPLAIILDFENRC